MNTRQRQLVLLIGFMVLLGAIFAFVNVGNTLTEEFTPEQPEDPVNQTKTAPDSSLGNSLFQQSINGLEALMEDAKRGLSVFGS